MKKILLFTLSILFSSSIFATGLSAGDIMFVGFNVDDSDNLAFLTFVDIPDGTTIYFTDNEWDGGTVGAGGAFSTGEGFFSWTNNTGSNVQAGAVIVLDNLAGTPSTDCGVIAAGGGSFNMSGSNEVVYAYCGTDESTPTGFLTAIGNDEFGVNGTLTGTGLTAGTNATAIDGDEDIGVFGAITAATTAANIADPANWTTQDGGGSQSADGTAPDWPADVPSGTATCNSSLPVSLTNFEVTIFEEKSVNLSWQTASEENNEYFSIQRSKDGIDFIQVGKEGGAGTTSEVQNYNFIDREVENGLHYYRLQQVDFDGAYEYSEVISVNLRGADNTVTISPNPSNDVITIQPQLAFERSVDFDIINMQGQVVVSNVLAKGQSSVDVNINDFPVGIYYLRLFLANEVVLGKIVKQ